MSLVDMQEQLRSQERLEIVAGDLGVIWGAEEIGKALGRTKRQAFYLLETGQLKGAVQIGKRWCITARALLAIVDPTASIEAGERDE